MPFSPMPYVGMFMDSLCTHEYEDILRSNHCAMCGKVVEFPNAENTKPMKYSRDRG
jgi:hypothetical protein